VSFFFFSICRSSITNDLKFIHPLMLIDGRLHFDLFFIVCLIFLKYELTWLCICRHTFCESSNDLLRGCTSYIASGSLAWSSINVVVTYYLHWSFFSVFFSVFFGVILVEFPSSPSLECSSSKRHHLNTHLGDQCHPLVFLRNILRDVTYRTNLVWWRISLVDCFHGFTL